MGLFALRLDVNGDAGARMRRADGIFKAVADIVRLPYRQGGRNDKMKIDEGDRAGAARLQVMDADRARGMGGDRLLDRLLLLRVRPPGPSGRRSNARSPSSPDREC